MAEVMFLNKPDVHARREALEANESVSLLKCLKCNAKLDYNREWCVCRQCGAESPVIGGIPRFFHAPSYYWGEVGRDEARKLLEAARKGSWVEAVRARFSEEDGMISSLLGLQRASWAPMLGFDQRSVALDIGSGYGAITHSLSRLVGELYSVEAIPERIEFTQERLRQEGIRNVRLIQASATALPLVANSFDLVVTNGVLEWVGEWDLEGDPRSAQLRFLGTICRLLKDDGLLVIGIENRFGFVYFLGVPDHSNIPYTSLVPRPMASFMLRHSSSAHHRTQLNPKKEYRTYTYSERGYRKLLGEAGFADVTCYWVEPDYNQPCSVIPLAMPHWVQEQFLDMLDTPGRWPRRSWRRRLPRVVAPSGFLPRVLPNFLLVASKLPGRRTKLQSWVEERLAESGEGRNSGTRGSQPIAWALRTSTFSPKSVVRLGDPGSGRDLAYIKVNGGDPNSADNLQAELGNRAKIREHLEAAGSRTLRVPRAYGTLCVGNTSYQMESPAQGTLLSRIVRKLGYFADVERVENDFARFFSGVIELTEVLQNVRGARAMPSSWREIPKDLDNQPRIRAAVEDARYFAGSSANSCATWIQHGDLSVDNIVFDPETGRIEVVDWDDLTGGGPPLYDIFHFFYSTGYLVPSDETLKFSSAEERWIASFNATFFGKTGFARTVRELILQACERLKVPPGLIPSLLVEFLLIRSHYYRPRSVLHRRVNLRLLQLCVEQNRPVLGRFQLRQTVSSGGH